MTFPILKGDKEQLKFKIKISGNVVRQLEEAGIVNVTEFKGNEVNDTEMSS